MAEDLKDELDEWLDGDHLSKWERDFCESMKEQLDKGWSLSENKLEKIAEIRAKQ